MASAPVSRTEIFELCAVIGVEKLGFDRDAITETASLHRDLGADSLDLVEMVMSAEEEFDVEIADQEAERMTTFGEFVDVIMHALTKRRV